MPVTCQLQESILMHNPVIEYTIVLIMSTASLQIALQNPLKPRVFPVKTEDVYSDRKLKKRKRL
jgi:predicted anti-sigma-YlaC factor YlaD